MKVLSWGLLLVVVGVLVYTLVVAGPSEAIAGVVVGSTLTLLGSVISRSVAAQEEQRKIEASQKLAEKEATLRAQGELRRRVAQAYVEAVDGLSYVRMWDRGTRALLGTPFRIEDLTAARVKAAGALSVIMLHLHGSDESVGTFEERYWDYVTDPGFVSADPLLKAVIELQRNEDRWSGQSQAC